MTVRAFLRLLAIAALLLALGQARLPAARAAAAPDLRTIAVASAALHRTSQVEVLLPDGYGGGSRRYPVLYLLHGATGHFDDWAASSDLPCFARTLGLIVVMPDAANGWYADAPGGARWETYHIRELIPYIDAHYRTVARRQGRAIAGLSMGGFGAMSYAARHPDLFAAAASFSGALDIELFRGFVPDLDLAMGHGSAWRYRAHSPIDLASNLRGLRLYLACGDGLPGPLDPPGAEMDNLEANLNAHLHRMAGALAAANIRATVDDYGPGTHSFPYWQRDLHRAMPLILQALAHPAPDPAAWSYRMGAAAIDVWGYHLAVRYPADGGQVIVEQRDATTISLGGTGTITLTTPPRYQPGRTYTVTLAPGARRHLQADAGGRLTFSATVAPSRPATVRIAG